MTRDPEVKFNRFRGLLTLVADKRLTDVNQKVIEQNEIAR